MPIPNTFSLSLQKQFGTERIIDDHELNQAFTALKFGSMVRTSSHRPNTNVRDIDKRTNGWKRCKEL